MAVHQLVVIASINVVVTRARLQGSPSASSLIALPKSHDEGLGLNASNMCPKLALAELGGGRGRGLQSCAGGQFACGTGGCAGCCPNGLNCCCHEWCVHTATRTRGEVSPGARASPSPLYRAASQIPDPRQLQLRQRLLGLHERRLVLH